MIKKLKEDIDAALAEIKQGMLLRVTTAASDTAALVANRVRMTGENAKGAQFSPYSRNPMGAWRLIGKSRTGSAEAKVKTAAKEGKLISYAEFRQMNNLRVDKKNFEFTGEMWQKFNVKSATLKGKLIEVVVGGTTKDSAFKIQENTDREKILITDVSRDEVDLINKTLGDWMAGILTKHIK